MATAAPWVACRQRFKEERRVKFDWGRPNGAVGRSHVERRVLDASSVLMVD
jgi:hypothetical protein